ncbi:MAG: hypothetical protein OHK0011_14250 [Turneriella sp.]
MPNKIATLAFAAGLFCVAALTADNRRKAIRREMIEMDIAVRNLTSTIAMADNKVLDDSLQRLVNWQIKDHPDLGQPFRAVLAEWQGKGLMRYAGELQKEAQNLRSFIAGRPERLSDADWARIGSGLSRILINCQKCHEAARKEPK